MKKKTYYKVLNIVMAFVLVFVSANIRPDIAHAMDPVPYGDVGGEGQGDIIPEYQGEEGLGDIIPDPDPTPAGEIAIAASTRVVSFGEVEQGSSVVDFKGVQITNTGTASTYINYQLNSADDAYEISTQGPMSLAPGQATTIYVKLKSNLAAGSYPATLIIVPDNEIGQTINVGITGQIVVQKPYITYMAVTPGRVTLAPGSAYSFSADVRGNNNPDTRVNWSVQGNNSASTKIDNNGNLVVGSDETATSFEVKITSAMDPSVWEFGIVDVQAGNYSVNTRSNPANGGTTSGGKTVRSGSDIELLAAPNNGFKFVNWTIDGQPVSNDQKFVLKNVNKNTEVVANFSQTNCYVKVKANHPDGGKVSDSVNVLFGAETTIMATPNSGFKFEGWYENNTKISSDAKFTVKDIKTNREITANFVKNAFSITAQVYPAQTGVVFGAGNYALGSKVTLTAKPLDGYVFDSWVYNNNVIARTPNLELKDLSQDYALTAVFKQKGATTFAINSSVAEGKGVISPAGNNGFVQGQNVTYTFTPSTGYMIAGVLVDGVNIGAVPSFTFEKLSGAHTISVKFAKLPTANTNQTPSTPAKKTDTNQAKKEKEQAVNDLSNILDTPDANADAVAGESTQIDPEAVMDFYGFTTFTGVLQEMDITEDTARKLIRDNHDMELMEKAAQMQYLAVSVNNDYSSVARETESTSYFNVASLPNLGAVVDSILTEDEKIYCLQGNPIQVNMNIFANNNIQTADEKEMLDIAVKNHMSVGNFFEAVLMKSNSGRTEEITELTVPMQIILEIPANLKADNRDFYILRAHKKADGTTAFDFLENKSTDSDKIIFTTDKFSSYAICYRGGKSQGVNMMKCLNYVIITSIIILGLVASILVSLIARRAKRRKARRSHPHNV